MEFYLNCDHPRFHTRPLVAFEDCTLIPYFKVIPIFNGAHITMMTQLDPTNYKLTDQKKNMPPPKNLISSAVFDLWILDLFTLRLVKTKLDAMWKLYLSWILRYLPRVRDLFSDPPKIHRQNGEKKYPGLCMLSMLCSYLYL